MTVGTIVSMTMDGQALPAPPAIEIKSWFDYRVTSAGPGADIRAEYEFGPMEVVEKPGLAPEIVQAMRTALAGMAGTKGFSVIDSRGVVRDADITMPANANPQLRQMLDGMRQSLRQLSSPFPEEAVGRGARWDTTFRITQNGLTLDQVVHVELAALDGNRGRMNLTLTQTAPAQTMSPPGLPAGVTMRLVSLASSGSGENHFDVTAPVPTSATMAMKMNMANRIESPGGKAQEMKMSMDMSMTMDGSGPSLAPAKKP
jgi:hypothetical protein